MKFPGLLAALIIGSSVSAVAVDSLKIVHVYVALADNEHQGIIPVSARLGNGEDPENNLYWGAAYGVKTFFKRASEWKLIRVQRSVRPDTILERCMFRHRNLPLYLVADAYKGERIQQAVTDFLQAAAGRIAADSVSINDSSGAIRLDLGSSKLVVYVGHEGLMDFALPKQPVGNDSTGRQVIILACMSRQYFYPHLQGIKADPVLWTTGLMAPEAYTVKAAVEAWGAGKSPEEIRAQAAIAYDRYQHCGVIAARRLLVTGY